MISVNVKFIGTNICSLNCSGHANYADYGKDIVCSAVSAIVIGGINALEEFIDDIKLIQEDNLIGIEIINNNDKIQIILNTILIQLQTIEKSYNSNIKIKVKHGGV